ncbi:MAG: hypothetical protein AB7T31_14985 [Gemmatimonadales bacterium]
MKRRRGERRKEPYACPWCGTVLRLVGSREHGAQIWKCPACGTMDRRLPVERRVIPPELAGRPVGSWWRRHVVALVVATALFAIALATISSLLPRFNP